MGRCPRPYGDTAHRHPTQTPHTDTSHGHPTHTQHTDKRQQCTDNRHTGHGQQTHGTRTTDTASPNGFSSQTWSHNIFAPCRPNIDQRAGMRNDDFQCMRGKQAGVPIRVSENTLISYTFSAFHHHLIVFKSVKTQKCFSSSRGNP